ncbi:MAG TPA: YciI family protein [Candidatus Polarisedimenticolia bacterium]|nr:YciI family protein [Candidatus Polarisedimenticolia bacterium]
MVERRDEENLDPVTERELRSLPRERRPPQDLERMVVSDLRREGLLGSRLLAPRPWMRAAASLALLAIGFAAGAWWMRPALSWETRTQARNEPRFLLLLHESPDMETLSHERQAAMVKEYKAWAAEGARQGFLLEGEKLREVRRLLPTTKWSTAIHVPNAPGSDSSASAGPFIGGYFVIRAANYEEALRLARTCPHLRHGGRIEVREIDPV